MHGTEKKRLSTRVHRVGEKASTRVNRVDERVN